MFHFCLQPAPRVDIAPLPCFLSEEHPPQYRPINWGKFREGRFAGDYADLGEELQISHYKLKQVEAYRWAFVCE